MRLSQHTLRRSHRQPRNSAVSPCIGKLMSINLIQPRVNAIPATKPQVIATACGLLRDVQQCSRYENQVIVKGNVSMPNAQRQHIDRGWFMDRLEAGNKSVRGLARHLE